MGLKIRTDLEIQPINYRGQKALLIADRLGLIKKPVVIQGEALEVLALIDGSREAEDIQLEFLRRKGYSLTGTSLVSQILDEFKKLWLLDTPEFQERREALVREFSDLPLRKAALAGEVYPEDPQELKQFLDQIIKQKELPLEIKSCLAASRKPKVLIAPHIDLRSGQQLYSLAYRCLEGSSYDRVVVMGTGHSPETGLMSLTEKDFATPLGTVITDKGAVKKLKKAACDLATPHDLAHQQEHSLEFQLLFLQHLLGNEFRLIPILFGSFQPWLQKVNRASAIPGFVSFLNQLRDLASVPDTLIIAGVDLSHIGPKFGHQKTASELKEATVAFDHDILEALLDLDAENFWKLHQEANDNSNVCGFPVLAVLLEIIKAEKGYLLGYDLASEEATQSAVSFTAAVFF